MLDWWNAISLGVFDALLGWLLLLPRWAAVVGVGVLTAGALTVIRKWTTPQDRLRRAAADLRRLKEIDRAARQAGDAAASARCRLTRSQVSLVKLKAEGLPLLVVMAPIALLATWAYQRLAYQPPRGSETVELRVYLPLSAEDEVLHLVPQPGLQAVNGWVQPVRRQTAEPTAWERFWAKITLREITPADADAEAIWRIRAEARPAPYRLELRWREHTLHHDLLVGQPVYAAVLNENPQAGDIRPGIPVTSEARLREVRLLGIPGWDPWLPAWLMGYLLVTIPLVPVLKRLLNIH